MSQTIAIAIVLIMFTMSLGLTILNLIAIQQETTIEGLYSRLRDAIEEMIQNAKAQ